ncbi:MAG: HyaD/HybD family hydrogenase maturation endopeptidase [Deltaproteobacteria bacterium]|nr:HyaD/HybD family hydrogenase maturation endopeptidase [Deltaproteobacteria bacterium]
MSTLVMGIGNLLLGDEGVGVHAVQALAQAGAPPGVTYLDAGTAILDALPHLEAATRVVVVDAMQAGGPPGEVYVLPLEDCQAKESLASLHGFDLPRVLALSRRRDTPPVTVVGVEPASLDWSLDLSPAVARALPLVLNTVRQLLAGNLT